MAPPSKSICALAMCLKPRHKTPPYCYAHYMKNWRYGTPAPEWPSFRDDLVGKRFGTLMVVRRLDDRKVWVCECDCGDVVERRTSALNRTGEANSCGDRTKHRRRELAEYGAAHCRLKTDKGRAADYPCVDNCGNQAEHWSYDHEDPDELTSIDGRTKGIKYSLKPEHYVPRCVLCHKRFDVAQKPPPESMPRTRYRKRPMPSAVIIKV